MTNDQNIRTLTPSFGRTFFRVLLQLLFVTALGALSDRYRQGQWWSIGYCESLIIPLTLFPTIVYLGFVPRYIQWSDAECRIKLIWEEAKLLPWSQLSGYGDGNNVFYLKFKGVRRLQIFAGAFPSDEWKTLLAFLRSNYPVKKSSWWVRAIWGSQVAQADDVAVDTT